jgi:hypothetical protein
MSRSTQDGTRFPTGNELERLGQREQHRAPGSDQCQARCLSKTEESPVSEDPLVVRSRCPGRVAQPLVRAQGPVRPGHCVVATHWPDDNRAHNRYLRSHRRECDDLQRVARSPEGQKARPQRQPDARRLLDRGGRDPGVVRSWNPDGRNVRVMSDSYVGAAAPARRVSRRRRSPTEWPPSASTSSRDTTLPDR